jgi:hypothetical protein
MSEVEEYLKARSDAERIAAHMSALSENLLRFADSFRQTPQNIMVPGDWPNKDELVRLVNEAKETWVKMNTLYNTLPNDQRKFVSPPLLGMRR